MAERLTKKERKVLQAMADGLHLRQKSILAILRNRNATK